MPIGIFDSGYGGLTILREIQNRLPQYDCLYLGDNARAPYGPRSFDVVYEFTLQAVKELFSRGCHLVVLACNTASAKALRSIQQIDLPEIDPTRRVLGVIRPTVEAIPSITGNGHIGLLATQGTVDSHSYSMELEKTDPAMKITEQACPMLVPLIENEETDSEAAGIFVSRYITELLGEDPDIDTIVLGCTHYPLLYDKIREVIPRKINIVSQGKLVAESLADYLSRHPEMECKCSKGGTTEYLTTENPCKFNLKASRFLGKHIAASRITL